MGFVVIIILIALAIIAFFAFSGGTAAPAPEIKDEIIEETVVNATVKDINIRENVTKRNHYLTYFIKFSCEDEIMREFEVTSQMHDAVEIGERGQLVFAGGRFIGFGNHGVVEADSAPLPEDNFTHDDYDESIDIEMDVEQINEMGELDAENQGYYNLFQNRKLLPTQTETIEDKAASLKEYAPDALLEKITVYPFLKYDGTVRRMFSKTYGEAMTDLLGFEGNSRAGSAADSESVNRNQVRVSIKIQENPPPLTSRITVEFGVNE